MNQLQPEDWAVTWMEMAKTISRRSKDPSTRCGAVVVDASWKRFLGAGFNGFPPRIDDNSINWLDREKKLCRVLHAESNAIYFSVAAHGLDAMKDGGVFVTGRPCSKCMLEIIRARVGIVVYDDLAVQPKLCDESEWTITKELANDGDVTLAAYSTIKGE